MSLTQFAVVLVLCNLAMSVVMVGAWVLQRQTGHTGWVDATWTFGTGAIGCLVALMAIRGNEFAWRQTLVAALAGIWCVRLGSHIALRTRASGDDPRYRALIEEWGRDAQRRMFWFLQAQAAVGAVLACCVALTAGNPSSNLRFQDLAGFSILCTALAGEALADRQLRSFRADLANRGKICDKGLWRWSRHPNYFFEWLGWLAYPIISIDFSGAYPLGWLAIAAPVVMYWVLVHVSGVPPLEQHLQLTRGAAFDNYRRRTPAFFPFPPRAIG